MRKVFVGLLGAWLFCAAVAFAYERNVVRERDSSHVRPPADVTVDASGRWLMPCTMTPKTMPCPPGQICLYAIQDGPDTFSVLRPDCGDDNPETPQSRDTEAEVIRPIKPVDPEISALWCYDNAKDCGSAAEQDCKSKRPPQAVDFQAYTQGADVPCRWTCGNGEGKTCSPPPPNQAPPTPPPPPRAK